MKNVAVLTGGFDAENVISYASSSLISQNFSSSLFNVYIIDIKEDKWSLLNENIDVDRNDFSVIIDGEKIKFDICLMSIHGAPVETGQIQGYLEMINIPYTGSNGKVMAITMDKMLSKQIVKNNLNIPTANFIEVRDDYLLSDELTNIDYPVFVKPNSAGSSFGVSKVYKESELEQSLTKAFEHSDRVLIEEFIEGREFAQGVLVRNGEYITLPVTEIVTENDFFDYSAKYEGKSDEITPAVITQDELRVISNYSLRIFKEMNCKDFARIDYIKRGDKFYFLELNTIPGLSSESIYPQQLRKYGISFTEFIEILLNNNI